MSRSTDKLVRTAQILANEDPAARRCLCAMRRSGRDDFFNAHLTFRRAEIEMLDFAVRFVGHLAGLSRVFKARTWLG